MSQRLFFICATSVLIAAVPGWSQTSPSVNRPSPVSSSQKTDTTRRGAKGPLPDPVLLDGSNQQPEKRPEYGMLGQFEIPGDDNAKPGGKVGGQQSQTPAGQPSGGSQDTAAAQGGGGGSAGASGQGGGAAGATAQGAGAAGGAQAPGGQQGNPGALAGAGMPIENDPNAKAEGLQVAGLTGDPNDSGGGQGGGMAGAGGGDVQKPQQVALGDPTMRIKPAANAPGVVGASTAGVTGGNTMQMESKMSSVGGGGSKDGKNSAEKGRVMPAGL